MKKYVFKKSAQTYKKYFLIEKKDIRNTLGVKCKIEHVGSTAIPKLGGKGIIDIVVGLYAAGLRKHIPTLEKAGYEFREKASIPERLFFRRDYKAGKSTRRVHVHLTKFEEKDWNEMIAFRNYLLKHHREVEEYAMIKRNAVKEANGKGEIYRELKRSFIEKITKKQLSKKTLAYFIIIRGPLGCGKSTIAKRLAEFLHAEYIPIDRILDEHNLTKDKEAGYISQRSFKKANEIISPKAKKNLQSGIPIIFDGNFYWKSQIEDLIKRLDSPHTIFTLKAPLKICIERDRQRGKTHGEDAAKAVYKKATEFDYGKVIDISKSLDKAINDILSCLPKSSSQERRDMRKIVEEGYEKGDYTAHFRKSKKPNKMEKHFLDALIKRISKKATVLDLGCGTGIPIDKYLVEKKLRVIGIDISQRHIALAKRNVPQGTFIKADFSKITFARQRFDAITSFYAIFHIPRAEHKALFLKMRKLLKKNGVFLITLGTSGSEYGEEENWAGAKMAWSTYSPRIYKRMIKECGFNIIESDFEGKPGDEEYHFWLLAQKKIPQIK